MCLRTILTFATLFLAYFVVAGRSGIPVTQPLSKPSHRAAQTGSVSGKHSAAGAPSYWVDRHSEQQPIESDSIKF